MDADVVTVLGTVKPYSAHVLIATGETDWIRNIEEDGALAEKLAIVIKESKILQSKARVILSNFSYPTPRYSPTYTGTEVFLLPNWLAVSNVNAQDSADFVRDCLEKTLSQSSPTLKSRPLKFSAIVLICSHMKRDKRCGVTAPLLHQTFEETLRAQDLWYEHGEHEHGKVLVECVSHIGGKRKVYRLPNLIR